MGWRSSVQTVEVHGSLDRERKGLSTRSDARVQRAIFFLIRILSTSPSPTIHLSSHLSHPGPPTPQKRHGHSAFACSTGCSCLHATHTPRCASSSHGTNLPVRAGVSLPRAASPPRPHAWQLVDIIGETASCRCLARVQERCGFGFGFGFGFGPVHHEWAYAVHCYGQRIVNSASGSSPSPTMLLPFPMSGLDLDGTAMNLMDRLVPSPLDLAEPVLLCRLPLM
nr:unnamed protein product [Digitaria exilis]